MNLYTVKCVIFDGGAAYCTKISHGVYLFECAKMTKNVGF